MYYTASVQITIGQGSRGPPRRRARFVRSGGGFHRSRLRQPPRRCHDGGRHTTPEDDAVRPSFSAPLAVALLLALAGRLPAAEQARLTLADEKQPLQEIRPLDRRVWVLTLE